MQRISPRVPSRVGVGIALLAAVLIAACGGSAETATPPPPQSTTSVTEAPAPVIPVAPAKPSATPPPSATPSPSPTPSPTPPPELDLLLFVGDSISAQIHFAARQRSAMRNGPEVRWLLAAGPGFQEDWPDPLPEFVDDAQATAIVTTIGVWAGSAEGDITADLQAEVGAFLQPLAFGEFAQTTKVLLLHSIDDPVADAKLQVVNQEIAAAATYFGLPVDYTLAGVDAEGSPAVVTIESRQFPVRSTRTDETHYCAAAALVMADRLLDELGVEPKAPTLADLEALYAFTPANYFEREGC